jgi:hypothetical protein
LNFLSKIVKGWDKNNRISSDRAFGVLAKLQYISDTEGGYVTVVDFLPISNS